MAQTNYTDGSTHQGSTDYGPPPLAPVWLKGQECHVDVIDPPSFVFVTEHVVYGSTPPASSVPVHDDASGVFAYHGTAPGTFQADVTALVAGKQGFRADTWNIGNGVTQWVPFDCRPPATTTTLAPTTTTTCQEDMACWNCHTMGDHQCATTTTTMQIGTPLTAVATTTTIGTAPQLPKTGSDTAPLFGVGIALLAIGVFLASKFKES